MRLMFLRALTVALAVVGGAAAVAFPKLIVAEAIPEAGVPVIAQPAPADVTVIRVVPAAPVQVRRPAGPRPAAAARRPVTPAPVHSAVISHTEQPPTRVAPAHPIPAAASPQPMKPRPAPAPTPTPAPTPAAEPTTPSTPAPHAPATPPAAKPKPATTAESVVRTLVAVVDEDVEDEKHKKHKKAKKPKKPPHERSAAASSVPARPPAGLAVPPLTTEPTATGEDKNADERFGAPAGEVRGHGKEQGKGGQGKENGRGKP
jgi:hypothetical protein